MIRVLKKNLRAKVRKALATLSEDEKKNKSREITGYLLGTRFWEQSRAVFCFISMEEEVFTDTIIEAALKDRKTVAVPHMHYPEMDFHSITSMEENWDYHPYGIKEPRQEWPVINPADYKEEEVLLVTPGLAFDRKGERLGRGRGFYDRFLTTYRGVVIPVGICYHIQVIEEVPAAGYDCAVRMIVTEEGCLEIKRC